MQFSLRLLILITSWIAILLLAAQSFSGAAIAISCFALPLMGAQYIRYIERWTEPNVGFSLWLASVFQLSFISLALSFREVFRADRLGYFGKVDWSFCFVALAIGFVFGMGLAVINMLFDLIISNSIRLITLKRARLAKASASSLSGAGGTSNET